MNAIKLLGSLLGNNSMGSNVLGSILGGGGQGGGGNILGSVLGSVLGGQRGGGGAAGLLGGLLGGGGGGGAGNILASVLGGGAGAAGAAGLLGNLLGGSKEEEHAAPTQDDQHSAELIVKAMCQAAKADGTLDDAEKENILGRLGDEVDQEEMDFVRNELSSPVDVQGLASSTPKGMEAQIYAFSLMSIKLDEQSEAQYLGQLAQALGLDANTCNELHEKMNAPKIFA